MNTCQNLTIQDYRELIAVQAVREAWGLEADQPPEALADAVYAAKFDYMTDGPGYTGPLYILHGGDLVPPMVLVRREGALEVVDSR